MGSVARERGAKQAHDIGCDWQRFAMWGDSNAASLKSLALAGGEGALGHGDGSRGWVASHAYRQWT